MCKFLHIRCCLSRTFPRPINLPLVNSAKNEITETIKQILNEAVRDNLIYINPLEQVEYLSKVSAKQKDSRTIDEMKKLFPLDKDEALKILKIQKYHTLLFLIVSSGMKSAEVRALKW